MHPLVCGITDFAGPTKGVPSLLALSRIRAVFRRFKRTLRNVLAGYGCGKISNADITRSFMRLPSRVVRR